MTLALFNAKMALTVKDTAARFTSADRDEFTKEAVRQYSRDKPRRQDALLTGDGSKQEFDTPSGWVDRFSLPLLLEFPVDEVPQRKLDLQDDLAVVQKSGVEKIHLTTLTLAAAETARLYFTSPHTVDVGSSSVPDNDFDAVANLAAHYLALALAAFYAEETDSSLAVDIVAGATRADNFRQQAKELLAAYKEHIEGGEVITAALSYHDRDIDKTAGRDYITHPRRFR